MREILKHCKKLLFILLSSIVFFSGCQDINFFEDLDFNGDLREQVSKDLGVTYRFYEYPDFNSQYKERSFITGKTVSPSSFPTYTHEDTLLVGWQYLGRQDRASNPFPSNFSVNHKNYISSIHVGNDSENLYAIWKLKCTVTFVTNMEGVYIEPAILPEGDCLEVPQMEQKYGNFRFRGWYTDDALTQPYDFSLPVSGDFTLYALWEEVRTITFHQGYGDNRTNEYEWSYNGRAELPDYMFGQRSGNYGFLGWAFEKNGTLAYYAGDVIDPLTENYDLYPAWSTDVIRINYIDISGTFTTKTAKYGRGAHATVGHVVNDGGYWSDGLYYQWKPEGRSVRGYSASSTKSATDELEYDYIGRYKIYPDPVNSPGSWDFANVITVTTDLTFYVYWEDKTYNVNLFKENPDGSLEYINTIVVTYNHTLTAPSAPLISGYTFDNWYQRKWVYEYGYSTEIISSTPFDFNTVFNNTTMSNNDWGIDLIARYTAGGSTAGFIDGTVTFTETASTGELTISQSLIGTTYTLSAVLTGVSGSFSYRWYIKGVEQLSTSSSITFETATLPLGVYDITVIAVEMDGGSSVYSCSGQITKS